MEVSPPGDTFYSVHEPFTPGGGIPETCGGAPAGAGAPANSGPKGGDTSGCKTVRVETGFVTRVTLKNSVAGSPLEMPPPAFRTKAS